MIEGTQHYWNEVLAKAGLSVWEGTSSHLVYVECGPNTLDNLTSHQLSGRRSGGGSDENLPARRYVKLGGAGDTQTNLFLQLALSGLSRKDQTFLQHYQSKPVPEVAAAYNISIHACYCRTNRIRQKLQSIARQLEQY